VFKQLNLSPEIHLSLSDDKDIDRVRRPWDILSAGHKIGIPKPLFRELKNEELEFYKNKFAGSQADRIVRAEAEKAAEQLKKTTIVATDGKGKKKNKSAAQQFKNKSAAQQIAKSCLD
ncbi:putative methionine-tRNA ligase-like protein, partial [Trifolium pratense]